MEKVLIITTVSGFLQQFELNDVKILNALGYEVHYASNFENSVYGTDNELLLELKVVLHPIPILKSPCAIGSNLKALKELCNIIKKEQISVIHCHNPLGGVLGRLAPLFCGGRKPYVLYTAHGFHFYRGAPLFNWLLFFPVEAMLARLTDCLITINEEDYRGACALKGKKKDSVIRIPGVGVETNRFFMRRESRSKLREEFGIPSGAFFVLSVGELNRNKNHEIILRAIAALNDKTVIYGICGEGTRRHRLERKIKELHLERQVKLFGFCGEIERMLWAADCFVFPSKREGLGMVALEAMAAGLPVVASDCRGTREYMEDGQTGYVCRTGTVGEYRKLLQKIKQDTVQREAMSEKCREKAKQFDIARTDEIMRKVYGNIPKGRAVTGSNTSEETRCGTSNRRRQGAGGKGNPGNQRDYGRL